MVAPKAFFQFPTSKYGLALDNWSIHRLSTLVGHGRARAMLLTAEKLTAEIALQTGMANRIGTLADAQAWAAEIAGLAPLAIQHAKRVLNDDGAIEEPVAGPQGALRQGVGQPGCDRSAGGTGGEAAAEIPGSLIGCCAGRCDWQRARFRSRRAGGCCARCMVRRPRSALNRPTFVR